MFTLRDYQSRLASDGDAAMLQGERPCMVAPTGAGKTVIIAELARLALARGEQVVVICHREEILTQIVASLQHHLGRQEVITQVVAGSKPRLDRRVVVGMVPTMVRRLKLLEQLEGCTLLADECFPSGTLIDGRPIESLKPGDMVRCWDHAAGKVVVRPVVRLFRNPMPERMIRIRMASGRSLACTESHPIWVESLGRYVPAMMVSAYDVLRIDPRHAKNWKLPLLPFACRGNNESPDRNAAPQGQGVLQPPVLAAGKVRADGSQVESDESLLHAMSCPNSYPNQIPKTAMGFNSKDLLLQRLQQGLFSGNQFGDDGQDQQEVRIRADEEKQPNAQRGGKIQDGRNTCPNRTQAEGSGRQRETSTGSAAVAGGRIEMENGARCGDWRFRQVHEVPAWIQDRHCMSDAKSSNRGGWVFSLLTPATRARCKKRSVFDLDRVDSVEILQRESFDQSGGMLVGSQPHYVYNIEVAEHHNYFAEGVLVHNCHHAPSATWRKVIEAAKPRRFGGLTATPVRPDGKGLGDEEMFDLLINGPEAAELMDAGKLCRYRLFAAPHRIDTKGMRKRGGDFTVSDMERRVIEIQGKIVRDWFLLNPEGRRTICVAVSVDHAHQVAGQFRDEGVAAEAVDGNTPKPERRGIFERFRSGQLTVLCACAVIDEGLDVPEATCLQVLRPTASVRLWRQLIGRVLRPADGKEAALIIDHTDNWRRLPPPDAEMDWQLNAEVQEPKEKRQQIINAETGEVEQGKPVETEVQETGDRLVEITPDLLAQAHPVIARRLLNERCRAEVKLVQALKGDPWSLNKAEWIDANELQSGHLRRWLNYLDVLEDDTLKALEPALGLQAGWAQGQMMLRMLLSPGQRLAATKRLQRSWGGV